MIVNYKDMSEMLESDRGAMAFYNALPISLQQKMYRGGVEAFAELYSAAGVRPEPVKGIVAAGSAVSATEYTGMVPEGGSLSPAERRSYGEVLTSQVMPERGRNAL